jgi:hypothetical protein
MNWRKVGVIPRCRKSARKPSSDIRIVVGAKRAVPLERSAAVGEIFVDRETL